MERGVCRQVPPQLGLKNAVVGWKHNSEPMIDAALQSIRHFAHGEEAGRTAGSRRSFRLRRSLRSTVKTGRPRRVVPSKGERCARERITSGVTRNVASWSTKTRSPSSPTAMRPLRGNARVPLRFCLAKKGNRNLSEDPVPGGPPPRQIGPRQDRVGKPFVSMDTGFFCVFASPMSRVFLFPSYHNFSHDRGPVAVLKSFRGRIG
jgi:hypothetical protein